MHQKSKFQIAVVGGGISGVTLALGFLKRGIDVQIYEKARSFGEIGAGVAFTPNARRAMKIGHEGVYQVYEKVAIKSLIEERKDVYFDLMDGYNQPKDLDGSFEPAFTAYSDGGPSGCHRAHFLDGIVQLLPENIAHFGKELVSLEEQEGEKASDGKVKLSFKDGTEAFADAVVGCDGIKSRVRRILVGDDHPSAQPQYTYKYGYRLLIPMADAIKAVGEQRAKIGTIYMGPRRRLITFPIADGSVVNLNAICHDEKDWPNPEAVTLPATKADVLEEYRDFGHDVQALLALAKPDMDRWAFLDLGDHPPPIFSRGRICILGDAAHATTPHLGAGAGFAVEDAMLLSELLADERVPLSERGLEAAFKAFEVVRIPRCEWLVQASRRVGDVYQWTAEGVGNDVEKIKEELFPIYQKLWDYDVEGMVEEAKLELGRQLDQSKL